MPRTFLILDDDQDNRFLMRHRLQKGFPDATVLECSNVEEAFRQAAAAKLDAVISDHHLGADDGITFIEQLRARGTTCPVVMVTASADPSVHTRAQAAGASRVFASADQAFIDFLSGAL